MQNLDAILNVAYYGSVFLMVFFIVCILAAILNEMKKITVFTALLVNFAGNKTTGAKQLLPPNPDQKAQ